MNKMFWGCENLVNLNLSSFNTKNVDNMSYMFYDCKNLNNLDLSSFDNYKTSDMTDMFYGCGQFKELDLSIFSTQIINYTSEFVIEIISEIKPENKKNYLFNKIKNLKYFEKKGDIIKFGQKIILVKGNKNYILNLIIDNSKNKNNKADFTILEYDSCNEKSFKDIELLLNKDDNINKRQFNYLIGINKKTKDIISNPLTKKYCDINKIKHMQISDEDDNDIKILLNDILVNLNNIEILCEEQYKIIPLSETCAGKTCLLYRIIENKYPETFLGTIGVDCKLKKLNLKSEREITLKFWDNAGQERFRSIALNYAKKCDVAVLLYDVTVIGSFYTLKSLYQNLIENENIKLVYIIANKIDKIKEEEEEKVDEEEVMEFVEENKLRFFKISCKENIGIKEFLIDLCNEIVKIEIDNGHKNKIKKQYKKKKK